MQKTKTFKKYESVHEVLRVVLLITFLHKCCALIILSYCNDGINFIHLIQLHRVHITFSTSNLLQFKNTRTTVILHYC